MASVFAANLLAGQAAFVTGGGSGIGAGIAKMLARQGARGAAPFL
jgi:NAD(P)-dependent dehydrogenase (short-subunit alcohol dehydrogenase family)